MDNLMLDKSPEPRDTAIQHAVAAAAAHQLREEDDILTAIDDEDDDQEPAKEPRRVSLPVSAPILIKSRSVEESIHREHVGDATAVSYRALPRDLRKNALASGHLIERQGSAPQLLLKRKPRGYYPAGTASGDGSAESSGASSPTGSITRNPTRLQMMSPLVQSALANKLSK